MNEVNQLEHHTQISNMGFYVISGYGSKASSRYLHMQPKREIKPFINLLISKGRLVYFPYLTTCHETSKCQKQNTNVDHLHNADIARCKKKCGVIEKRKIFLFVTYECQMSKEKVTHA